MFQNKEVTAQLFKRASVCLSVHQYVYYTLYWWALRLVEFLNICSPQYVTNEILSQYLFLYAPDVIKTIAILQFFIFKTGSKSIPPSPVPDPNRGTNGTCLGPRASGGPARPLEAFLGSGPNRGQSPVEWGDFPFVSPFVRLSPPLGHPARPETQPAMPEA